METKGYLRGGKKLANGLLFERHKGGKGWRMARQVKKLGPRNASAWSKRNEESRPAKRGEMFRRSRLHDWESSRKKNGHTIILSNDPGTAPQPRTKGFRKTNLRRESSEVKGKTKVLRWGESLCARRKSEGERGFRNVPLSVKRKVRKVAREGKEWRR